MELKDIRMLHLANGLVLGGVSQIILELCEATNHEMGKVMVASSGGIYEKQLAEMGIEHIKIPDLTERNPLRLAWMCRKLKKAVKDNGINYIHCHHRMGVLIAKILVPSDHIIYHNHLVFSDKRIGSHFILENVNIVAVGEGARDNVTGFFGIKDKGQITVIRNAVREFHGEQIPIPEIADAREKGWMVIACVARLDPVKGVNYLLDAAEILIKRGLNLCFLIVGDGSMFCELKRAAEVKGLSGHVKFLGFRSDVQNVLSQCDLMVLPSLAEGLPLSPMEAFSVRKAVIATNIAGTREVVKDGYKGLLVQKENAEDIASKIRRIYEDPGLLTVLSDNAYESYKNEFSFSSFRSDFLNYYGQL